MTWLSTVSDTVSPILERLHIYVKGGFFSPIFFKKLSYMYVQTSPAQGAAVLMFKSGGDSVEMSS